MSRITGLATGIDIDSVVEETMQAHQSKIDAVEQQKKLVELQQEMYREIITECRNFYDKYFDIAKSDSILLEKNWTSVDFTSSNSSVVSATATGNAVVDNYEVKVVQLAEPAKHTISKTDLESLNKVTIELEAAKTDDNPTGEIIIDLSKASTAQEKANEIKNSLSKYGVTASYNSFSEGIVISSKSTGESQKFNIKYNDDKDVKSANGTNAKVYISTSDGSITYSGEKNSTTIDGVTFAFNGVNATEPKGNNDINNVTVNSGQEAKLIGKTNVDAIKDKLIKFVNDYNTIMIKLNTKINEKRARDYMPLTDAQKKEMSENEIKLWEEKVAQGQLSRDSDLTRIRNGMKEAMKTLQDNISFEDIGITPVKDYSGNNNGTFIIDDSKLTSALEENMDEVKKVFLSSGNSTGSLNKLKDLFDRETQKSSSPLLTKAGMEGSSTASNNTLSNKIKKYEEQITRLKNLFSTKQQELYSKYATLETMMNTLNNQMSSLTAMFSS